ncbi:hypothetical protein NUW58_g5090 [Xylaria curta]|uniref:Uncharacterized protein n=1 Tax=Xylaria curta TaxID=42375 RepID=A0ACC1P5J5_9PEZI|nr:hypothetical protein NUW58_g5090 [Xylaria curta]
MAPMVVTAVPPPVPPKIKRPPIVQTNGAASQSSSSPSVSTKKPPPITTAKHNQTSNPTGIITNGPPSGSSRPSVSRSRRDTLNTSGARTQKNNAVLRSASLSQDKPVTHSFAPRPEVDDETQYILKKFAGSPPSLIVHMHLNHFRFDQQDGTFPWKSPMKIFMDHVRTRTIPHDLLDDFTEAGVPFYDGCLIVQVHDHRSVAQAKEVARPTSKSNSSTPFSIHNSNPYITPSPYAPYPKENISSTEQEPSNPNKPTAINGDPDKENGVAPNPSANSKNSKEPPKANVYTVVLHPTPESVSKDLRTIATTPKCSVEFKTGSDMSTMPPPTPLSAVPPTPSASNMPPPAKKQKREKTELGDYDLYAFEGQILRATTSPLHLEVPKSKEDAIALIGQQALAEEQEKYMLTFDERLSSTISSSQGTTDGADGNNSSVASSFEPRFERFNILTVIKKEHAEKKEQDRIRQAENERKIALQKQQQAEQQAILQRQHAAELETKRREEAPETRRQTLGLRKLLSVKC